MIREVYLPETVVYPLGKQRCVPVRKNIVISLFNYSVGLAILTLSLYLYLRHVGPVRTCQPCISYLKKEKRLFYFIILWLFAVKR